MQPAGRMMRGYVKALEYMLDDAQAHPHRMLTSCHFHESFVIWRLWDLILRRIDSCSVITCHAVLPARLTADFGIGTRRTYLVSPEAKWAGAFSRAGSDRHFPDQFERLRRELEVAPGDLYLVAAGVLGKIYCHWVKAAGGIAIDIGSLADHWCGHRTRGSISALHAISPVSPDDYARIAAQDPRAARLLAGSTRSRTHDDSPGDTANDTVSDTGARTACTGSAT